MASHKLSIIIPAYNEQFTIEELIDRVVGQPLPQGCADKEIIVIDDGSTDGTTAILRRLERENPIRVIVQEKNKGKGAAVQCGIDLASGDLLLIQDADLEYDPRDYTALLRPIMDGVADAVYGSRFIGAPRRVLYFWHAAGSRFITAVSNMLTNLNLTDMVTGFKAFRSEVFRSIRISSKRFGMEAEITAKLAQHRLRIYEVPISYTGREYWEGKKATWKDGLAILWAVIRYNLSPDSGEGDEGFETLRRMNQLDVYTRWLLKCASPFIGKRILEVGAGTGNLTKHLVDRELVVATDINEDYLRILDAMFEHYKGVKTRRFDLAGPGTAGLEEYHFDTVICFNVLEHVEHDVTSLRNLYSLLVPGGRAILLVPAMKALYGSLDQHLGHYRRYSQEELSSKAVGAGFSIEHLRFVNALAVPGWYFSSRV